MGFNSSFTGREQNLEHETLEYLQAKPQVGNAVTALLVELKRLGRNKKSLESDRDGTKVRIINNLGQQMVLTVIGVNSTSLISSEMEGHLAFTFIKNLSELTILRDEDNKEPLADDVSKRHFTLIKEN